jgi:DNA repair exonuclease SbcCD ATPase subunit
VYTKKFEEMSRQGKLERQSVDILARLNVCEVNREVIIKARDECKEGHIISEPLPIIGVFDAILENRSVRITEAGGTAPGFTMEEIQSQIKLSKEEVVRLESILREESVREKCLKDLEATLTSANSIGERESSLSLQKTELAELESKLIIEEGKFRQEQDEVLLKNSKINTEISILIEKEAAISLAFSAARNNVRQLLSAIDDKIKVLTGAVAPVLGTARLKEVMETIVAIEKEESGLKQLENSLAASILKTSCAIARLDGEIQSLRERAERRAASLAEVAERKKILGEKDNLLSLWDLYARIAYEENPIRSEVVTVFGEKIVELANTTIHDYCPSLSLRKEANGGFTIWAARGPAGMLFPLDRGCCGGFEGFVLNFALKTALADVSVVPRMNLFIIDEGFDCIDETNSGRIQEIVDNILRGNGLLLYITHRRDVAIGSEYPV